MIHDASACPSTLVLWDVPELCDVNVPTHAHQLLPLTRLELRGIPNYQVTFVDDVTNSSDAFVDFLLLMES